MNPSHNIRYQTRSQWPLNCAIEAHWSRHTRDQNRLKGFHPGPRWCSIDGIDAQCWECSLENRGRIQGDIRVNARPLCYICTGKAMGVVLPNGDRGPAKYPNGYNSCSCVRQYADGVCTVNSNHIAKMRARYIKHAFQDRVASTRPGYLIFDPAQPKLVCPCGTIIDVRDEEAQRNYDRVMTGRAQWMLRAGPSRGTLPETRTREPAQGQRKFDFFQANSNYVGWASMCGVCKGLLVPFFASYESEQARGNEANLGRSRYHSSRGWTLPLPQVDEPKFPEALN